MTKTLCRAVLLVVVVFLNGCVAAAPLYFAGTGAAVGVVGAGVYNASQDDKTKNTLTSSADVPHSVVYRASGKACMNAIVEVLSESGESLVVVTDQLVKTDKRRITKELGVFTSRTGKAEVYAVKTVSILPKGKGTSVSLKIDLLRKTAYTDESKKEWPDQEAAIRARFFNDLAKKLRPA